MNYPVQQYPPQYPQAPAPQQPYPAQGYPPQQPPQYAPPAYAPQGYPAPQQMPPAQPLAQGSLDDYYNQPSSGGGPSISWSVNGMPKPEGTSYAGIVARDVSNADVQQQTDPKTGQPKFYRDGRPQFVMKVPLKVWPSPEFPEGEAVLFVRGQMREELVRAMAEVGTDGAPKGGDAIQVTLVQRKPSRGGGMPMNVFQISYTPAGGPQAPVQVQQAVAPSPAPAQPQQVQYQQPVQQAAPQQLPQQVGYPGQGALPPLPESAYPQGAQPIPPAQQFQQYPQQPPAQAPVQQAQPQQQLAAPADMSAEQAALLARITGQPQQG